MRKARQKKMDGEDEILMMGYLLMKGKWEREEINSENSGLDKYFYKGNLMGHILYCGKDLDLKIENHLSGNLYCVILFCSFVLHFRWEMFLGDFSEV